MEIIGQVARGENLKVFILTPEGIAIDLMETLLCNFHGYSSLVKITVESLIKRKEVK